MLSLRPFNLTLCHPRAEVMGSSVHSFWRKNTEEEFAISFQRDLPHAGTEPVPPALAGGFFFSRMCATWEVHRLQQVNKTPKIYFLQSVKEKIPPFQRLERLEIYHESRKHEEGSSIKQEPLGAAGSIYMHLSQAGPGVHTYHHLRHPAGPLLASGSFRRSCCVYA